VHLVIVVATLLVPSVWRLQRHQAEAARPV
jgi:hypothetical protein